MTTFKSQLPLPVRSKENQDILLRSFTQRQKQENMNYLEKLKSPLWQKKRLEVLNRDGFKCCKCSDETQTLHIHHKTYKFGREPWEYELSNFETLCEYCHRITEAHKADTMIGELQVKRIQSLEDPTVCHYLVKYIWKMDKDRTLTSCSIYMRRHTSFIRLAYFDYNELDFFYSMIEQQQKVAA